MTISSMQRVNPLNNSSLPAQTPLSKGAKRFAEIGRAVLAQQRERVSVRVDDMWPRTSHPQWANRLTQEASRELESLRNTSLVTTTLRAAATQVALKRDLARVAVVESLGYLEQHQPALLLSICEGIVAATSLETWLRDESNLERPEFEADVGTRNQRVAQMDTDLAKLNRLPKSLVMKD